MIPALVLTAGLATRLRPLSLVRAKAALPVAGEPLGAPHPALAGRRRRHRRRAQPAPPAAHAHRAASATAPTSGCACAIRGKSPVLGSAGGPRRAAARSLGCAATFLIVNGDTLTDVDHRRRRRGTIARTRRAGDAGRDPEYASRTSTAAWRSTPSGDVTGFVGRGSPQPSYHFIGVQVAEAAAFAVGAATTCRTRASARSTRR